MATMRDITGQALQKIGVKAIGENAVAEESSDALTQLNMMLHDWKLAGVDITHSDLTDSDTFPLGSEYQSGTVYLLAQRIAPDYSMPVNFDADDFFRKIQAAYLTIASAAIPDALVYVPSQRENLTGQSD